MFTERTLFKISEIARSIWLRPVLYTLGTLVALVLGPSLDPFVPKEMYSVLQENAVANVLQLLASPMLAVAIFSLGTMVQAFQVTASSATPRARPLVTEDRTAQNAISTFLGAFLFSILGITGLSAGVFSGGGRMVLFVLSILMIAWVIATFIGWMNRLTNLGGVTEVIDQVEAQATKGFETLSQMPGLGGSSDKSPPKNASPTYVDKYGYIQHIDMDTLNALGQSIDKDIFVVVRPGDFIHPHHPLLRTSGKLDDDAKQRARKAFIIGGQRTFRTDPIYGLIVLSEIASRALSPGVNDPGTALDVIETSTRILGTWRRHNAENDQEVKCDRVFVPDLDYGLVLDSTFAATIRHGAGDYNVAHRLLQMLTLLSKEDPKVFAAPAERLKKEVLDQAQKQLVLKSDYERLKKAGDEITYSKA